MSERRGQGPAGRLADVGHGGAVALERVVAVGNPESAPVHRALRRADKEGRLVDLSFGRRVRSVLFLDSGHVVTVAIPPGQLAAADPVAGADRAAGMEGWACSTL